jgi:SAM-dependent methyltransferase
MFFLILLFHASDAASVFKMGECHSNEYVASVQKQLIRSTVGLQRCNNVGVCTCAADMYFNGRECANYTGSRWLSPFETLSKKWEEVPFRSETYSELRVLQGAVPDLDMFNDDGQVMSGKLQALSSEELVDLWQGATTDDTFTMFYASILTRKSFIDIGSGLARQTLQFVLHGAYGTFVDIVESNLEIIRRVAVMLGVGHRVSTILFVSLPQLQNDLGDEMFDAVCAFGSLHHTPREIIQEQSRLLRDHLKPGGLWIQLAYVSSLLIPNL